MSHSPRRRSLRLVKPLMLLLAAALLLYLAIAYFLLPAEWMRFARRHPALEDSPRISYTADGIPGDPLNVAFIATETELKRTMIQAHWYPADPLSLKSCLEIAEATVLKRPYDDAPVSSLYLFGRKEDLAFEQPVNDNPRKRHHVRFWCSDERGPDGRPIWFGSVTYDERVGLSRTTGQVTHHIDADIDAERDRLFHELQAANLLREVATISGFHLQRTGKNGGGDPWHTDGDLKMGTIGPAIQ